MRILGVTCGEFGDATARSRDVAAGIRAESAG